MKKKNYLFSAALAATLATGFVACSSSDDDSSSNNSSSNNQIDETNDVNDGASDNSLEKRDYSH